MSASIQRAPLVLFIGKLLIELNLSVWPGALEASGRGNRQGLCDRQFNAHGPAKRAMAMQVDSQGTGPGAMEVIQVSPMGKLCPLSTAAIAG